MFNNAIRFPSALRWAVIAAQAGLFAACDQAQTVTAPSESAALAISSAAAPRAEAEIFARGVISDENRQYRITFTANGRTAYFSESVGFFPFTRQSTIYVSHYVKGEWTEPEVAPFSGEYSDIDPIITPDGSRLYFSSIRPVNGVTRGDIDIWYVERTPTSWSEPIRLGSEVNSPADELYPSASADGDLYFAVGPVAPTAEMDWDIYTAKRLAPREPITVLNTDLPFSWSDPTADWEFNPEVSVDGRTLVFASLRPGGYGYGDLYVSHYHRGEWSAPQNLGPAVNTQWDEFHPTLTRDGWLYFVRNKFDATKGDFYRIETKAVELLHPSYAHKAAP